MPEPDGSLGGLWSSSARRTDSEIAIGSAGVSELATECGTPFCVLDEDMLYVRAHAWRKAMDEAFFRPRGTDVYYANKAFLCVAVAKVVAHEGLAVDTCSEGELRTVLAAGVPGSHIRMHDSNKLREEVELALRAEVGHFVIDFLARPGSVDLIARNEGIVTSIMLRAATGVRTGGHEYMSTAVGDQEFNLSVASGAAWQTVRKTMNMPDLRLLGLHPYISLQILVIEAFEEAARAVLNLRAQAHHEIGLELREVNFDGGYGIRYVGGGSAPSSPAQLASALVSVVAPRSAESGIELSRVSIEPGRNIVDPTGVTLYTMGMVKTVKSEDGSRRYASVGGGMSDNIRPALYNAAHTAALASREGESRTRSRVVGKYCEGGNIVVCNASLPEDLAAGDILTVSATGAYGRSVVSGCNHVPRPGVVAIRDGVSRWTVCHETAEDLLILDVGYLRRDKD